MDAVPMGFPRIVSATDCSIVIIALLLIGLGVHRGVEPRTSHQRFRLLRTLGLGEALGF